MSAVLDRDSTIDPWWIDALLERYVYWREQCIAVHETYERWADAERGQRRLTYAGYMAALDGEERAARAYAHQVDCLRDLHNDVITWE